jgi:hypothetical protein
MKIVSDIVYWSNIILYITLGIGAVVGLLLFYFFKIKKPKKEHENSAKYAKYKREDSLFYVPNIEIDNNMIIMDNKTRFVGAILSKGYDFYTANLSEQYATNKGYESFIKVIDKPIQKRIYCKSVDLNENIKRHEMVLENIEVQLMNLYKEGTFLEKNMSDISDADINDKLLYEKAITDLVMSVKNMEWQRDHMKHIISYLESLSGIKSQPVREIAYFFDWKFNEKDFPVDISFKEILARAEKELDSKAKQYKHALANAKVKVRRATNEELEDMIYRHNQPISAELYNRTDLEERNEDEMIITSSSLEEYEKAYKEVINQEFLEKMNLLQNERESA